MMRKLEQSVILTGTFLIAFMGSGLNPAIPSIAGEFHAGASESAWIVISYMLTCTALPVPFSRWAEWIKPEKILAGGLGIFMVSSVAGFFAGSMAWLLAVRSIQGIGTAMIYSTGMWILIRNADESDRGKLLGLSSAAMYLGLASGPAVGGILNQHLGWRMIFAAAAVISAAAFCASFVILRDTVRIRSGFPPPGKIPPSGFSCFLYILSAVTFTAGLQMVSAGWWGWAAAGTGLIVIIYYVFRENRETNPLLTISLFRKRPGLGIHCLSSMISCGVNFAISYLLSLYMQLAMGFSPQKAGMILIAAPAVQALTSVVVGRILDRGSVMTRSLTAAGILGIGAVAGCFAGINEQWPEWAICAGLGGAGLFSAVFTAPNTAEVMKAAGKERLNLASALISTVRSLGNSMGAASAAFVSGAVLGQARLSEAGPEALNEVMKTTFSFWAVLCILGFIMELRKKV